MVVVLFNEPIGDLNIIDVVEDQRSSVPILILGFEEAQGVVAPVAKRVEMVCGMPAVVEAETIALNENPEVSERRHDADTSGGFLRVHRLK